MGQKLLPEGLTARMTLAMPVLAALILLGRSDGVSGERTAPDLVARAGEANGRNDDPVTFTRDVAPILQSKCQECHRPGSIGPMPLMTYEDARRWAPLIKQRVESRMMPPWHVDPSVGIQEFKNDASLSDVEIATIVRWVDTDAPRGDPAHMPPPRIWPSDQGWRLAPDLGEPDLIIKSEPYTVRAQGQDQWWNPVVETGLTQDRWIRAIEVRPSVPVGRRVTHHVVLYSVVNGRSSLLTEWAMGKVGEVMPEGTGRLLRAGSSIEWDVHYYSVGEAAVNDQVELGLWFYPEGYQPQLQNRMQLFRADPMDGSPRGAQIDIPPGEIRMIQGVHVMNSPVRIESFQPHMHLRGVAMSIEAIYPNGRRELLSHVDRFQHNWQISYKFADHVMPLLPAGTLLVVTAWHDNTANNPNNPDPTQWVGFGRRTVDEMAHAWIGLTTLPQDVFERLVAERQADTRAQPAP